MQVKLRSFNKELIRGYMESSSIMEQGITYMQHINHSSREVAKETAIRQAMEFCERKWYNDSTGYISNEWIAFTEFEKDVKAHRYFYIKGMKSAEEKVAEEAKKAAEKAAEAERQEELWEKEYERARKLREYCKENNLDFDTENKKVLDNYKKKEKLGSSLMWISLIGFLIAVIMWIFTKNWFVPFLVGVYDRVLCFVCCRCYATSYIT